MLSKLHKPRIRRERHDTARLALDGDAGAGRGAGHGDVGGVGGGGMGPAACVGKVGLWGGAVGRGSGGCVVVSGGSAQGAIVGWRGGEGRH